MLEIVCIITRTNGFDRFKVSFTSALSFRLRYISDTHNYISKLLKCSAIEVLQRFILGY